MVVGFNTTYAISAYHHWCCEFETFPWRGVQHHVIKSVNDLRQFGSLLQVLRFPPPIKLTANGILDIKSFFSFHEITIIEIRNLITNTWKTNQLKNVSFVIWWDERNVNIHKRKLDDRKKQSSLSSQTREGQTTILYTNTERSDLKGYFPSMLLTKIKIQLKLDTAKLVQSLHNIT
jgi:hypothetical protein